MLGEKITNLGSIRRYNRATIDHAGGRLLGAEKCKIIDIAHLLEPNLPCLKVITADGGARKVSITHEEMKLLKYSITHMRGLLEWPQRAVEIGVAIGGTTEEFGDCETMPTPSTELLTSLWNKKLARITKNGLVAADSVIGAVIKKGKANGVMELNSRGRPLSRGCKNWTTRVEWKNF